MLQGLGQWVRDWAFRPYLDWVQVEVTTACNARCVYCPTTVQGGAWARRHMSLADFQRILPMVVRAVRPSAWGQPLVHLQGWGEPLLNPDFLAIVAEAKSAGLRVGTTSNAMAIDSPVAASLVEAGVDSLSLSTAGIDGRNDAIRRGTRLEKVFAALTDLDRHKKERGSATPSLHIAHMLMTSGLNDLECLPKTFAGRGVEQIVVSTLGCVPEESLRGEAIVPQTEAEFEALDRRLGLVADTAAALGMELHYQLPPPPGRRATFCVENVQAAAIVTVDGQVTPCMMTRFDETPVVFGDLGRQSLSEIWGSDAYRRFRRSFLDGAPPPRCLACDKLDRH